MKFLIVLVALFGLGNCAATCSSSTHPNLEDDIKDITKLIPVDKIKAIAVKYLASDSEVQAVVKFMKGKEFAEVVQRVNSEKLVIQLYTFLCANGVPIYEDIKTVNDLLDLPEVTPPSYRSALEVRTVRTFLNEVEAVLPLDEMKKVFQDKVKTSKIFKSFYDEISSSSFRSMVDEVWNLPSVKDMRSKLEALDVNVGQVVKIVQSLLGWVPN